MADLHTLPLKVQLYLADTKHLTNAQHGAYLQLLMLCWIQPGAAIDLSDDKRTARMISATGKEWRKLKPVVMAFFERGEDGLYRQKRLTQMHDHVTKLVAKRREAGKKGGRPRKNRSQRPNNDLAKPFLDSRESPNGDANPLENGDLAKAKGLQNESGQSQSQNQKERTDVLSTPYVPPRGGDDVRVAWPPDSFERFWEAFGNKVGKYRAKLQFRTTEAELCDRLGFDVFMEAVRRHRATEVNTIPMKPSRWLLERGWEDEPAPPVARPNGAQQSALSARTRRVHTR